MGPGEESLDDHGVGAGSEVRLRPGPSVCRGRRRDRLFPARGAGELEPREAALVAARDRDEVAAVHHSADAGARRVAGRGGGQAQRTKAVGWGRGGEGGRSEAARGVGVGGGGAERQSAEKERRGRHFFSGLVLRWRELGRRILRPRRRDDGAVERKETTRTTWAGLGWTGLLQEVVWVG